MKAHYNYLRYLLRHKWYVFRAGLKVGAPLWRLIIHDWSKFTRREWRPYVDHFYRKDELSFDEWAKATEQYVHADAAPYGHFAQERFNMAWLFHQNTNKHHWQYWLLQKDDGGLSMIPMPEKYVREMVADWAGAGRAITGRWEVAQWYKDKKDSIRIHFETRVRVEELLQEHYGYEIKESMPF